jgi:hypothetical protein
LKNKKEGMNNFSDNMQKKRDRNKEKESCKLLKEAKEDKRKRPN